LSVSASACKSATRRRANKFMDGEFYWNDGHRQASFPSKAHISVLKWHNAIKQKLEDIESWKRLAA
jgi:hypothetical protein